MIRKLPRWVELGAFVLAVVAGCVNAVGLLGFEHQSISHLSGVATHLGVSFSNLFIDQSLKLIGILLSFLLGAVLSGFLLHGSTLKLGRHYETALLIEAFLLLAAALFLSKNLSLGHYPASAACGLQNALVTTYSSAIIRTTHVTGLFTDLGIMLGEKLKGKTFDRRKALLFCIIIFGFVLGGALGAVLFSRLSFSSLYVPAGVCALLAMSYRLYLHRTTIS